MTRLLEGLRIVEGSAFIAAPLGGMTLAQLGADVIRFDDLNGGLDIRRWPVTRDGASLYWAGLNKGKRSIAVDLRSPRGRELLTDLITAPGPDAGIFSTNLPARGWLDYETLRSRRADLIALNIVGAADGSAQVDYTVNALTGFPFMTGPSGHQGPINQVLPAWDIATGYAAAMSLLAAERFRSRTGRGQLIRLPLQNVALAAVSAMGLLGEAQINGCDRERLGNHIFGTFGRDFRTRDGRYVMVCVFTPRQARAIRTLDGLAAAFTALEARLGLDLENEEHRWRARAEIAALLEPWMAARTLAELKPALNRAGVLWSPYRTPRELLSDPAVTSNPMFQSVEQPGIGSLWSAASPLELSQSERLPPQPAPRLGQHTDEILSGILGLSEREIGRLHDQRVIGRPASI